MAWLAFGNSREAQAELPPACSQLAEETRSVGVPGEGSEQEDRNAAVLALDLGEALSCALSTALVPWGSKVVRGDSPNPGSSMPSSSLAARDLAAGAIARRQGVRAVVWLSNDERGYALWVYDARSDRSTTREVPPPPFSASDAAALALSIKTVLRIAGMDPTRAIDLPPNIESPAPMPPPVSEARIADTGGSAWRFGFASGVRFGPLGFGRPELRYGVELRWSPGSASRDSDAALRETRAWGALAIDFGVPLNIQNARFVGQWLDLAPELWLGLNRQTGAHWSFVIGGAAALHITQLSGVARELNLSVESLQLDPALSLRGELQCDVGRATFALQPGAELWLRRQRFLVEQQPVANSERGAVRLMLAVRLPLD